MVCEISKEKSPLLPDRSYQGDFFVCDIFDAVPKGDIASMEHPLFSLSTKPDRRIRRYEHNKNFIEIQPSAYGLATIHDRDVLIFCISQLMGALNEGQEISQTVRFKAYELLVATNRMTNGQAYEGLKRALERLGGTRITTNIVTGGREEFDNFGIIEKSRIVRETREGKMQEVEVKLSDWMFNAIRHKEVLTLHKNYFRLRKPLERRMYDLGRKHCGKSAEWSISLELLQKKCGSGSTMKEFRRLVQNIVKQDMEHNHMPDYALGWEKDNITFRNRETMPGSSKDSEYERWKETVRISPETYHDARLTAPGYDVYVLEEEWKNWMKEPPRNPDAAFLGFCKAVARRNGKL